MKKILVIGESCRDVFVYCDANRLCPDMPVPVLSILRQTENEGMAKNVQRNIHTLISDCDIITNQNWTGITKTRYIHEHTNHMFIRIDSDHNIKRLNLDINDIDLNYELIVISDYNKGFLTEEDIEQICNKHNNVFIDTKKILGKWAEKAKYIKINNFEYENSKSSLTPILKDKLIHTRGGDGCVFQDIVYPVNRVEVKDSSGAGDSFMSGLVCKYLETKDIISSIIFANKCAADVVQHRGVTTI
jgi:bifunctional ADP-heptose synthase (sugar kinase/adenylyltransferase)